MEGKKAIATTEAPAALGPYSQAVKFGNLLFLSGQIPLDPKTSKIVGETTAEQTVQVMKNITAVLAAQGLSFDNVLKSTVFLKNMEDFAQFNETYQGFLKAPYPARSTVEVARLPKDVRVEIEMIACVP